MSKKNILAMALLVFSLTLLYSQKVTISGYVSDSCNNERLIGATLFSVNNNRYCVSNEQGYYSLAMELNKPIIIQVSYVGYKPSIVTLNLKADTVINFHLSSATKINEVVVTSHVNNLPPDMQKLTIHQIEKLPALAGEPDVMKTLQLLPGIQSGTEGHTGMYVKGGEDDQNLILLDGVPVYNPNHMFGFFSIFNEQAIQDITVYKGNFPAKYGGRLSSVVDIQTKEGNSEKIGGSVSMGILASTMNIDGPLFSDKTTFFVSGRISYLELVATPIIQHFSNYNSTGYQFYDYSAKITHRFNRKQKLTLSYYRSYDYGNTDEVREETAASRVSNFQWEETTEWGNHIFSLAWNYAIRPRVFLNTIANYSTYDYFYETQNQFSSGTQYNQLFNEAYSSVTDKGIQTNCTWYLNSKSTLRAGVKGSLLTFLPGVTVTRMTNLEILDPSGRPVNVDMDTVLGTEKIRPKEFNAYIENEIKIRNHLIFTPGLRYVLYNNHSTYQRIEPRLNLLWKVGKANLNISYTETNQFNHLLETSKISQSTDLWVPTTTTIPPEKARQLSVSGSYMLKKGVLFSTEAYIKKLKNLLEYQEGSSYYLSATTWDNMVTIGTGEAYGVTFTLEKKFGKTTGWVSYTLSESTRNFADLNNGEEFPFAYSRPHDLKIVLMHSFNHHFDLSGTWVYHSGNNLTYTNTKYFGYYLYLKRNGYRLPDYHRLDVTVNYHFATKHFKQQISLGAYNVYNRENIYSLEYYYTDYPISMYYVRERPLFPIIPSLTYRVKF